MLPACANNRICRYFIVWGDRPQEPLGPVKIEAVKIEAVKIEARHDARVKTVTKEGPVAVIILGGGWPERQRAAVQRQRRVSPGDDETVQGDCSMIRQGGPGRPGERCQDTALGKACLVLS